MTLTLFSVSVPSATAHTAPLASSSGSSCTTASAPGRQTSLQSRPACKRCHLLHNSSKNPPVKAARLSLLHCFPDSQTEKKKNQFLYSNKRTVKAGIGCFCVLKYILKVIITSTIKSISYFYIIIITLKIDPEHTHFMALFIFQQLLTSAFS